MSYTGRIDKIIHTVLRLMRESAGRQEALEKIREENQKLKLQIDSQANTIDDLNNKIKIIKLAHSLEAAGEPAALKRKINEYIREIDNSIALLND